MSRKRYRPMQACTTRPRDPDTHNIPHALLFNVLRWAVRAGLNERLDVVCGNSGVKVPEHADGATQQLDRHPRRTTVPWDRGKVAAGNFRKPSRNRARGSEKCGRSLKKGLARGAAVIGHAKVGCGREVFVRGAFGHEGGGAKFSLQSSELDENHRHGTKRRCTGIGHAKLGVGGAGSTPSRPSSAGPMSVPGPGSLPQPPTPYRGKWCQWRREPSERPPTHLSPPRSPEAMAQGVAAIHGVTERCWRRLKVCDRRSHRVASHEITGTNRTRSPQPTRPPEPKRLNRAHLAATPHWSPQPMWSPDLAGPPERERATSHEITDAQRIAEALVATSHGVATPYDPTGARTSPERSNRRNSWGRGGT